MGDDAHQPISVREPSQGLQGQLQGLFAEGAEALVHKQRVHLDAPGGGLHLVRQPQSQGEGGEKGLAAGEGVGAALGAVVVVQHVQV